MRAIVIHRPGSYDRLAVEDHPDPEPAQDEVLIDVAASGVNFADSMVRMGLYRSAREQVGWPVTPGFEVAGKVVGVGEGVEDLVGGESVLAVTRFGGYATRVVVPRALVFRMPEGLTAIQAAGLPTVFLTAWYALFRLAYPRPGDVVLVHSAAGGAGGAIVQLAKVAQCTVVGVVGATHKVATAREMGADFVVDTSREELWPTVVQLVPQGFDLVLDANGASTLRQSYRHLRAPGKLVVYGFHTMLPRGKGRPSWPKLAVDWLRTPRFDPLDMTTLNRSVLAFNLSYLFAETQLLGEAMGQILEWLDQGAIRPPPVTPFPFERVADAQQALETGRTVGKLVLTM